MSAWGVIGLLLVAGCVGSAHARLQGTRDDPTSLMILFDSLANDNQRQWRHVKNFARFIVDFANVNAFEVGVSIVAHYPPTKSIKTISNTFFERISWNRTALRERIESIPQYTEGSQLSNAMRGDALDIWTQPTKARKVMLVIRDATARGQMSDEHMSVLLTLYKDVAITVIGINDDVDKSDMLKFVGQRGRAYPLESYVDLTKQFAMEYIQDNVGSVALQMTYATDDYYTSGVTPNQPRPQPHRGQGTTHLPSKYLVAAALLLIRLISNIARTPLQL